MELVETLYRLTMRFPTHEVYGLTQQVRRAIVSVPANIAEGHAREHIKEYLNHLSMAQGSLAEVQTLIEIAARLRYVDPEEHLRLAEALTSVAKQLHALRNSLKRIMTG